MILNDFEVFLKEKDVYALINAYATLKSYAGEPNPDILDNEYVYPEETITILTKDYFKIQFALISAIYEKLADATETDISSEKKVMLSTAIENRVECLRFMDRTDSKHRRIYDFLFAPYDANPSADSDMDSQLPF